jgi:hypothetical protein
MTTLTIDLPDKLVKEAQDAGLLVPEAVEVLLREAMRKRRIDRLFESRQKLADDPLPPMSPEEIQNEINAYRREIRRASGS